MSRRSEHLLSFFLASAFFTLVGSCRRSETRTQPDRAANETCPVTPLELFVTGPDGSRQSVLRLDAQGALFSAMSDPRTPLATFDSHGCVSARGETEAEAMPDGNVWTANAIFEFADSALHLPTGRTLRIMPDGTIEAHASDGGLESVTYGRLGFTGYASRSACAARVLLAVFFASMPSMAASDGHPPVIPPPRGSSCPRRRHATSRDAEAPAADLRSR